MAWVCKLTGAKMEAPHQIEVGGDVTIELTKTPDGAVKVVINAPEDKRIVRRQKAG